MAIFKTKNSTGRYHNSDARQKVIRYILDPKKTIHNLIGFTGVDPMDPVLSMDHVAQSMGKIRGVQLRHFIFSFHPNEPVTPAIAFGIGGRIVNYLGQRFQGVFAVHEDTPHLHIHVVINSTSYVDGHSYRGTREEWATFTKVIRDAFAEYGLTAPKYVTADDQMDEYE